MEFMDVNIQAPVDVCLKMSNHYFGQGPSGEVPKVAISMSHGLCIIYCEVMNPDASKYIHQLAGPHAFRETDYGIQFYDGCVWKYFNKMTQELYCGYLAEKELLDE